MARRVNRAEMREEEEKLHPYAQAAYEASGAPTDGRFRPWEGLSTLERRPWVEAADAVLTAYDPEWPSNKAGL
jgi:hypothetical protein